MTGKGTPTCRICDKLLTSCKVYFQRNSICEAHAKAPECRVDGAVQRWCQQCCRFQDLNDFEGEQRTCRARLEKHNARRRQIRAWHKTAGAKIPRSQRRRMLPPFPEALEPSGDVQLAPQTVGTYPPSTKVASLNSPTHGSKSSENTAFGSGSGDAAVPYTMDYKESDMEHEQDGLLSIPASMQAPGAPNGLGSGADGAMACDQDFLNMAQELGLLDDLDCGNSDDAVNEFIMMQSVSSGVCVVKDAVKSAAPPVPVPAGVPQSLPALHVAPIMPLVHEPISHSDNEFLFSALQSFTAVGGPAHASPFE